jgi:phospholipase C
LNSWSRRACNPLWVVAALAANACSGAPSFDAAPFRQTQGDARSKRGPATTTPIKHIVFIIQENRSFNNLFMGFPNATTASFGYDSHGNRVRVRPRDLWSKWDPGHNSQDFFLACDGKGKLPGTKCTMDGFENEKSEPNAPLNLPFSYVPQSEIAPYWTLARDYVLADHMFASNLDGSFIAHQYGIAAYASRAVDYPVGTWGCEGGKSDTVTTLTKARKIGASITACFSNPTIASEADAAGVSWRFYADSIYGTGGFWSAYQANEPIYDGPDWKNDVVNPPSQFLTDVAKGQLAAITWITPIWANSDHPVGAKGGPAWIASLVNAIGTSKFWKSTAVFIMWDDWGGWFDPVKPIYKDYDGLGFRVPLLIVSPYARKGSVTHEQYETASILRFEEDDFGLGQLAKADARANDPANDPATFDFTQKPRKFKKITGSKPASFWMQLERTPSQRPADDGLGD